MTAREKMRFAQKAKKAGLSMGEYFRRAAEAFRTSEDEKMLEQMIDQMNKSTAQASAALDDALAFIEASNKRIAALEPGKKAA